MSPRPAGVLSRDEYFDQWAVLHGGHDPRSSRLTRGWLSVVYDVARPIGRLGVPPDVLTVVAPVLAAAAVGAVVGSGAGAGAGDGGGAWLVVAALLVALSGAMDNVDGAVAVLTGRTTRWGVVLDSMVDRVCDGLYLVALWAAGAPGWLCVLGGVLLGMQESVRARAAHAGMTDIGVVTIWERPTRVAVTAMFLLGAGLYPGVAPTWATAGSVAWTALGLVGCTHVVAVVRRRLGAPAPQDGCEPMGGSESAGGGESAGGSGSVGGGRPISPRDHG